VFGVGEGRMLMGGERIYNYARDEQLELGASQLRI
jgi:hypothetical protein